MLKLEPNQRSRFTTVTPNRNERRRAARQDRRDRNHSKNTEATTGPFFTRHPLSDVPREQLASALGEFARKAMSELPKTQEKLVTLLTKCELQYFLSNMALYSLYAGITDDGKIVKRKETSGRLEQFHLEFAQAAYLTIPPHNLELFQAHPKDVQAIADTLIEIFEKYRASRFVQLGNAKDETERQLLALQERIRLHTLSVRNWGYYQPAIRLINDLYSPLDDVCRRLVGLTATDIVKVFDNILRSSEILAGKFRERLYAAISKQSKRQMIQEYCRQFGIPDDEARRLLALTVRNKWSRENVLAVLLSHSGTTVREIFRFSSDEIASLIDRTTDEVERAFELLHIPYGGLSDTPLERIFLGNPVWDRPLIKGPDGKYFCSFPQLFPAFSFHIFDRLFSLENETKKLHAKRRANYLEDQIAASFDNAFGEHKTHRNVKWSYQGIQYETDLLIQVDAQLFIIEAKSNRVSWPALRGAPERMKREIENLFIAPALQSQRLEEMLQRRQQSGAHGFEFHADLNLPAIKETSRLSVTLEDFSTIQSNLSGLEGTGLVPDGFPKAVTISLSDLQVIFDILENPVERMHYLQRRKTIQENWEYHADELDLLGLYLSTGFDIGEFEEGKNSLMALGMSAVVDDYFQARDHDIDIRKPQRVMTPWFRAIRDRLAGRKPSGWSMAALALLDLGFQDQQKLEEHFSSVCRSMRRARKPIESRQNTTAAYPQPWRKTGMACVAFYEDEREDRHNMMQNASLGVFENSAADHCLVIARDVDGLDYPYTSLAVFDRPEEA